MTRDGFIRELEESLQGEVSQGQISETLDYYRSYINEQMNGGQTADEVMESLGSPRLIARSVIDAYGTEDHIRINEDYVQVDEEDGRETGYEDDQVFVRHRRYEGPSPVVSRIAGYAILAVVLISLVVMVHLLLPVILIAGLIWFFIRMFSQ